MEEEPGYEFEVEYVELEDMSIDEVFVLDFDGTNMTCAACLTGALALQGRVEQHPVQYSEKDWDPGYAHPLLVNMRADLTATVTASIEEDRSVEFLDAQLDERRVSVPWRVVERAVN